MKEIQILGDREKEKEALPQIRGHFNQVSLN